jgi:hypothetical protein
MLPRGPQRGFLAITARMARWARAITGSWCRWYSARTATSSECERRLKKSLGTASANSYRQHVRRLIERQANGNWRPEIVAHARAERVFKNLDGIRFLTHQGGCGGTRQDAQALCGLLAGYIHHPNVAGATVLSLGCQHAQASMLMDELRARDPAKCASRCWSSISRSRDARAALMNAGA